MPTASVTYIKVLLFFMSRRNKRQKSKEHYVKGTMKGT